MTEGLRCMLMRGGSSKGAFFLADELPTEPEARDDLLRRIVGSPDPRQIDGVGGAHPLTSKVAIVGRGDDAVDLNYLFLQIGVETDVVSDRQNCGNLLAGVGPFAIERGLVSVEPTASRAEIRIRMLNTGSIATARFGVESGEPIYDGDTSISGVPGSAARIDLEFADVAGATAGSLLPTASTMNMIDGIACTLIDNGMPVVVLQAKDVGVTGYEPCADLEANCGLCTQLERIRLTAGQLMNLGDVSETTIPKVTMVAPPRDGGDLCTRTFIPHRCHDAIGVLGAVSVATAALLAGSPAHEMLQQHTSDHVRLEHPTGFFDAVVSLRFDDAHAPISESAGIIRTARKLMDGLAFPREPTA